MMLQNLDTRLVMITDSESSDISYNIVKFCTTRQLTLDDAQELNYNIKNDLGIINTYDDTAKEYNNIADLWRQHC
jgi:hypothetical protein